MERISLEPRNGWQAAVENLGFGFHTTNVPYWDESACYAFSLPEILKIEEATGALWELCLTATQHVIDGGLYDAFQIPKEMVPLIERSWLEDHPSLYGRFDLAYDGEQIKLLEFNADTPTSLFEAGIVQWYWLRDRYPGSDQFNSIHERLVATWEYLAPFLYPGTLHFSCVRKSLEDLTNTEYLRDCAMQAGLQTRLLYMDEIGWDPYMQTFVDGREEPIRNLFKLYPWEWLAGETFGRFIPLDRNRAFWVEPPWKMILSNKAILPLLWQLFPGHPHLLAAYREPGDLGAFVRKPLLSREGANIRIMEGGRVLESSPGQYGKEGFIYQEYFRLPDFQGNHPILGSWIIGQEAAGMGIRESEGLITGNLSRFVPHLIR
jgi:glutathionylspermidine synthase